MKAFGDIRCILWTSRAVLNNASLEKISNKCVRYMGSKRDKLYGVEEGHGEQKVCTNKTEKKSNIISY